MVIVNLFIATPTWNFCYIEGYSFIFIVVFFNFPFWRINQRLLQEYRMLGWYLAVQAC